MQICWEIQLYFLMPKKRANCDVFVRFNLLYLMTILFLTFNKEKKNWFNLNKIRGKPLVLDKIITDASKN